MRRLLTWATTAGVAIFLGAAIASVIDSALYVEQSSPLDPMACVNGTPTIASDSFGPVKCDADGNIQIDVSAFNTPLTINPTTSGGLLMSRTASAGSTNATVVKASAGQVYHISAYSKDATPVYLSLYDKATAPTCNSDTIVWQDVIPANSTAALAAGLIEPIPYGLSFANGIGFCATTGADGTGSLTAGEVHINIGYK